jgi:hypothetical protein
MRRCPHRGFCLASCWTSSRISSGIGGRPAVFGQVHLFLTRRRCQGEQGAGRHDSMQPRAAGQQPRQRGDHGAVGPVRLRAGDLTAQDRDLVPQNQDLHVLRGIASPGAQASRTTGAWADRRGERARVPRVEAEVRCSARGGRPAGGDPGTAREQCAALLPVRERVLGAELAAIEEAVTAYRQLAATRPDAFLPDHGETRPVRLIPAAELRAGAHRKLGDAWAHPVKAALPGVGGVALD